MTQPDPRSTFLADPKILAALRGTIAKTVPGHAVGDLVNDTVVEALEAESTPDDRDGFKRWLCKTGHRNALDHVRTIARRGAHHDDTGARGDDVPGPCVTDMHDANEGLGFVQDQIDEARSDERRPGRWRIYSWLLRHVRGETYAEIALADGVSVKAVERAVERERGYLKAGWAAVAAALFLFLISRELLDRQRAAEDEANKNIQPVPSATAPAPSATPDQLQARQLRDRAQSECAAGDVGACYDDLEKARALDPAGESDPAVAKARQTIRDGTRRNFENIEGKGAPKKK